MEQEAHLQTCKQGHNYPLRLPFNGFIWMRAGRFLKSAKLFQGSGEQKLDISSNVSQQK